MALTEILGMGIAIQLRNMFSAPANAIVQSSRVLSDSITRDQAKAMNGWRLMGAGASMMFVGTGMLSFLGAVGSMSIKAANDMEVFRLQIGLLAKDQTVGNNLFQQLKMFSTTTPFTIPQVMAGARNLLSYGITAQKVIAQLKQAGDWASMMNMPIEEAAMILGKVHSGAISYALRSLQRAGISIKDIADEGGPVKKTKTGLRADSSDPEKFLEAVNRAIDKKFGGGMAIIMHTVSGMITNIKDQIILMGTNIGEQLLDQVKGVTSAILTVFNPAIVVPFGIAVGQALGTILRWLIILLEPVGRFVTWFMVLANAHPGVVKLVFVMITFAGVILNVVGASLILLGIWAIISSLWASAGMTALIVSLGELIVPISAVILALVLLRTMFANNFLGISDVASHFYQEFKAIAGGLLELFTTITSGTGYMTKGTADNLKNMGLYGVVIQLFEVAYRVYKFFYGMVEGMKAVIEVGAFLVSTLWTLAIPLLFFIQIGLKVADALFGINLAGKISSDMFKDLGAVVGFALGVFIVYRSWIVITTLAQWAWTAAVFAWTVITKAGALAQIALTAVVWAWQAGVKAVTAAQWLLNVAMDANPIGLIITAVAIVIVLLVVFFTHLTKISNWFNNTPIWAKALIVGLVPGLGTILMFMYIWEQSGGRIISMFENIKNKIVSAVTIIMDKLRELPPWLVAGASMSLLPILGPLALAPMAVAASSHAQALTQTQSNQLASQTTARQQEVVLRDIHGELTRMNAQLASPKPPIPFTVNLDGKQIATTVNKINKGNQASGR